MGGAVDTNFSGKEVQQELVVSGDFVNNILEVKQVIAQCMIVKLVLGKNLFYVISVYAPLIGSAKGKDSFGSAVYDLMVDLKRMRLWSLVET